MSVIRVSKTKNYTVMSNEHLKDRRLPLKAKGLLSVMLSLPDTWDYSISGLVAICKESETAVKSTLDELKSCGYLVVTKKMPNETESGRIEYVYDIFEKAQTEKQGVEKQGVENLGVENVRQSSTKESSTNKSNTDESSADKKKEIVTTNINPRDLMSAGGIGEQRIYSRIMDMCVPVPFNGSDRRRPDYAARTAAAKELLGL